MSKPKLTLDKKQKYILTCSYGPDSMALFNLLVENKYDFVVAHVNYHILTNANEDEENLRNYCKKHNVKIYVLDKPYNHSMGNEEDVCRKIRYSFFKNLAKSTQISNILIAHNQDDHIETYILQKERNNYVSHYGLAPSYTINGVSFIRPLLSYSKKSLLEYCKNNDIPYSIDYSNFDHKFRRNYIRHEVLNKLDNKNIKKYLNEIKNLNKNRENIEKKTSCYIEDIFINYQKVKSLNIEEKQCLIYLYMKRHSLFETVSKGFIQDFFEQCKHHKGTFSLKLNKIIFECSYDNIIIYKDNKKNYSFQIMNGNLKENSIFEINDKSPVFKELSLQKPYFIKNLWPENIDKTLKIGNYNKKINRCLIDWKMPLCLRKVWPAVFDENGKIIYVPRYRKDYKITSESFLSFNSTKLIKEYLII